MSVVLAYVFNSEADANVGMAVIEGAMRNLAMQQGYTLDAEGNIIGRDALTGEPDPDAQHVIEWGEIMPLSDGRYGILSWREYLSREVNGTPLWAIIDSSISVPYTHEDVTAIAPIPEVP